jgi:hypothetical protein
MIVHTLFYLDAASPRQGCGRSISTGYVEAVLGESLTGLGRRFAALSTRRFWPHEVRPA